MSKGNFELATGKETWKQLEQIERFGYDTSSIFADFVDVCLNSLLSLTHNIQYPDILDRMKNNKLTGIYEDRYMQIVERYRENKTMKMGDRPADYFARAWGALQKETEETQSDILGDIYMAKISRGAHGQYFTPEAITDMMAALVGANEGKTVDDPACGSGRFFISLAKQQKNLFFHGTDIAPICAKMTALNMWLFDLNADIYQGNTITLEMQKCWKIRKGGFVYEVEVKERKNPFLEKEKIIKKPEQQRLFEM